MKMVKKVLLGLAAAAAVLALAGCDGSLGTFLDEDDDFADSDTLKGEIITGSAANAKIDKANDTLGNARVIELLKTKHYGSRAKIVQTNIDKDNAHGVQGFVFNVVEHEAGDKIGDTENEYETNTVDFMILSVGYAGAPIYYISAYRNVTSLQATNFGASVKTNAAEFLAATTPVEYEVVALPAKKNTSGGTRSARNQNLNDGFYKFEENTEDGGNVLTVAINVVANDDGSYTVEFYDPSEALKDSGSWISSSKLKKLEPQKVEISNELTGYTKKTQTYIGVYANIYPYHDTEGDSNEEFKLTGSWRLSGIKGEAEVAEFED